MKPLILLITSIFLITCNWAQSNDTFHVKKHALNVPDESKTYTFIEQMPEFPGGEEMLRSYLASLQNSYPQMELDNRIEGKVLVRFVVNEDGSVGNVTIDKGVSPGLDKAARQMVEKLPAFKPGMQQGKPVKVYYTLPVIFKLP